MMELSKQTCMALEIVYEIFYYEILVGVVIRNRVC